MSKQVIIRTFNEEGINAFGEILTQLRAGVQIKISPELLYSDTYSDESESRIKVEKVDYVNKSELVKYLVEKLQLKKNKALYFDKGMWTWLAAFYFDNICLGDKNGNRKVNESAFYVLKDPKNYTKYYRHLLAYPCRVFSEIGESAKIFLNGTFAKRGEITEQFGAYQEIALNKGIIDAANILYWDDAAGNIKKGAAGKNGGSARRLVRIIRQYQMTYDLNSMKGDEIVNMLPAEFSHWRQ